MEQIEHNLKISEPMFLYFVKNMGTELSRGIQYNGVELEGRLIYFKFKSSQNSLSFKIYGGIDVNNAFTKLKGKTNEIFEFFRKLKYENT